MFRSARLMIAAAILSAGAIATTAKAMPVVNATQPDLGYLKVDRDHTDRQQEKRENFLNNLPTMQEIMRPAVSPPAARISALHDGSDARRLIEGPNGVVGLVLRPG